MERSPSFSVANQGRGHGNAGSVIIDADDRVVFDGTNADRSPSAAFSTVGAINFSGVVEGDGGDVQIRALHNEGMN